jgi:cell division protein FtsL
MNIKERYAINLIFLILIVITAMVTIIISYFKN